MFHFSMEKVKSASRGIFWLGGALPAVGSLFTDFLSPLGPYSFFLALLLGMLTVLALIAAMIPPVNRVLHSWSAHWAEGVLAVLLCGFLVFSGMFALELSTDPHKGFLASESEKLAEIQKILLNIADTTARIDERTERIEAQTARTDARTERIEAQTSRTDARTERVEGKVADIDRKMAGLKRETSSNPRKELANLGVPYNSSGYFHALRDGDEQAIGLFFQAGMDFYAKSPWGVPSIEMVCRGDTTACIKALQVAINYGIDINSQNYKMHEGPAISVYGLPNLRIDQLFFNACSLLKNHGKKIQKLIESHKLAASYLLGHSGYTIFDLCIYYALGDAEAVSQFIKNNKLPCEQQIKIRRALSDFFVDFERESPDQSSLDIHKIRGVAKEYEQFTQQLEKALGVSR